MTKVDAYRATLQHTPHWEPFLLQASGLPGPRGNLELAHAVAEEGDQEAFERLIAAGLEAPENTPQVFLLFCGILGLGKLLAGGESQYLERLRVFASDPRWRVREAVATALQRLGAQNMDLLLDEMQRWSRGNWLEKRAAAAALCEPALLHEAGQVEGVLAVLDEITRSITQAADRKDEAFKSLRKSLGYCWSVAVVALPESGKAYMEKWIASRDPDVVWIMRENLKKNRLARMDSAWVESWSRM